MDPQIAELLKQLQNHGGSLEQVWDAGEPLGVKSEQGWEVPPDPGRVYLALCCKTCRAPIPIIALVLDHPTLQRCDLPDTYHLCLCVNEACRTVHIYKSADIYPFRWPGKEITESNCPD